MKIISNIFYGIFITLLLGVAGLFLVPLLPIDNNIEMKIVESGSMEPAIKTGSLVMITPTAHYNLGDVITFESTSSDIPTTHRIVNIAEENGTKVFTTKGDANEEADTNTIAESNIIGTVQVSVPYVGFVLDFARQPLGFAFLIVLPALMIILGEIEKIWREIRKKRNDKNDGTPTAVMRDITKEPEVEVRKIVRMIEIGKPIFLYETITRVRHLQVMSLSQSTRSGVSFGEIAISICAIVTSVCFASVSFVGSTVSYFNDTESSLQNKLQASLLDFKANSEGPAHTFAGALDSVTISMTLSPEENSVLVDYQVSVEKVGGGVFCDALLADAGTPVVYIGPLLALTATGVVLNQTWDLKLSLDPLITNYLPQEVCVVDLVFTAWYKDGETGVGYSDIEKVRLTLTAPTTAILGAPLVEPLLFFAPESFDSEIIGEEILEEADVADTEKQEPTEGDLEDAQPTDSVEEEGTIIEEPDELEDPEEIVPEEET